MISEALLAVSDSKGGIYDPDGLDLTAVEEQKDETGSVMDHAAAKLAPQDEMVVFPISWRTARHLNLDPPHRPNVSVERKLAVLTGELVAAWHIPDGVLSHRLPEGVGIRNRPHLLLPLDLKPRRFG